MWPVRPWLDTSQNYFDMVSVSMPRSIARLTVGKVGHHLEDQDAESQKTRSVETISSWPAESMTDFSAAGSAESCSRSRGSCLVTLSARRRRGWYRSTMNLEWATSTWTNLFWCAACLHCPGMNRPIKYFQRRGRWCPAAQVKHHSDKPSASATLLLPILLAITLPLEP